MDVVISALKCIYFQFKSKIKGLTCKVNLEKAYDMVDWSFLQFVLSIMGFVRKWCIWMAKCVSIDYFFSILINGSAKGFFRSAQGLQQGDPLSLALFIEIFIINLEVNELSFLAGLMDCQSALYLPLHWVFPFVLGHQVSWEPIIDKFSKRLASWRAKYRSFDGRITLLKSVLSTLLVYFLSAFKCPKKVISSLEKITRDFVWGDQTEKKREHLVSWQQICIPIEAGGLKFCPIKEVNVALLINWLWLIGSKDDAPLETLILDKCKIGNNG